MSQPGRSSCAEKKRPRNAKIPSVAKTSPLTHKPRARRSCAPSPSDAEPLSAHANTSEKTCWCRRICSQSGYVSDVSLSLMVMPKPRLPFFTCTPASISGCGTGKLRSRTVSSNWKMAALAPMPSARVRTAVSVNPQLLRSVRSAKRTSCSSDSARDPIVCESPRELRGSSLARCASAPRLMSASARASPLCELALPPALCEPWLEGLRTCSAIRMLAPLKRKDAAGYYLT